MDISVVIPAYNEEESLPELCDWIVRVMNANKFSYEIIFVNDGSTDNTWDVIEYLHKANENVHGLKFMRNYGKAAALNEGFGKVKGDVVITLDADLQDSPDEIPELYKMIIEDGFDVVSGWKKKRYDNAFTKNFPSKIYNGTVRFFTGIKLHDMNSGIKAYKKKVVKSIEVYGEMHRYIPVLAKFAGFTKIGEKVVEHRPRKYGVTKFGLNRFVNGLLDLMSVLFIGKFSKKPMHFFGSTGIIVFLLGFISALWLGISKLVHLHTGTPAPLVTSSPYFYFALVCMIIGFQLFLAGYIAELVSRNSPTRNQYTVDKQI
ncbi:MAG: glycosyltransferase family 2 protein [Bacteroidales bacterium]|jgi:glycosyltransferase involved in cell wall biosynthesis|nr:glycosyltransferase family 2 protein [Bacteroidales bacterium]